MIRMTQTRIVRTAPVQFIAGGVVVEWSRDEANRGVASPEWLRPQARQERRAGEQALYHARPVPLEPAWSRSAPAAPVGRWLRQPARGPRRRRCPRRSAARRAPA